MTTSRAYFEEAGDGTEPIRKLFAFTAKVIFALGLVLSATFALAEIELLAANASHISNSDLVTILSVGDDTF